MALESMRPAYAKDPVREMIEARQKAERDEISRLETARLEGKLAGKLEGRLEGKIDGRLEGKLEMTRALLVAGVDRQTVQKASGLTDAELEAL